MYGKKIHVTLSKHSTVQMPQAGSNVRLCPTLFECVAMKISLQEDALTEDYSNSPLHRFKVKVKPDTCTFYFISHTVEVNLKIFFVSP